MAEREFDADTELKLAEVRLGMQAEEFVKSPMGRYLLGRAQIEVDDAIGKLKKVSPADTEAVRALQNRVILMESFGGWIQDAISNGKNAEAQIHEQDDLSEH